MTPRQIANDIVSTGVPGLDSILQGGLPRDRIYLVDGDPGTGKTTLALQFLIEGRQAGERGLYVTLSETATELRAVAASHGYDLTGIALHELISSEAAVLPENQYTVFHPSEVELGADHQGDHGRDRRSEAAARGVRLAVGDAAAGAGPAPVSAADPRAEAAAHRSRHHRAAARRLHVWRQRSAAPQPGERGRPSGTDGAGVRRRPAPAACRQGARRAVRGGLSRHGDQDRGD